MIKKLIKIANSYTTAMDTSSATKQKENITSEFTNWLEKFNKKYKHILTELAKK